MLADNYKGVFRNPFGDGLLSFKAIHFDIDTRISVRNVIKLVWHYIFCCARRYRAD